MQVAVLLALSTWVLEMALRPLALACLETVQNPRHTLSPPLSWLGVAWWGSARVQVPFLSEALVLLILCAIVAAWWRFRPDRLAATGLGLFMGGAMANTNEQLRFGSVTDYIPVSWPGYYYMINPADLAIVVGGVVLVAALFWSFRRGRPGA